MINIKRLDIYDFLLKIVKGVFYEEKNNKHS